MTTPSPITPIRPDGPPLVFTEDDRRQIASEHCSKGSETDVRRFIAQCERTGLSPFLRQIYCTFHWNKNQGVNVMSVNPTIDGLRVIAQRSGEYRGQKGPYWCGDDGVWQDYWIEKTPPRAAKVGIWRKNFTEPVWGFARWESYNAGQGLWGKMPEGQLAKCAEALGFRKAFPQETGGLYSAEEMEQAADEKPPAPAPQPVRSAPRAAPPAPRAAAAPLTDLMKPPESPEPAPAKTADPNAHITTAQAKALYGALKKRSGLIGMTESWVAAQLLKKCKRNRLIELHPDELAFAGEFIETIEKPEKSASS